MYVIKRNGQREKVYYDKITARNMKLAADLSVDTTSLSKSFIMGLSTGMSTRDIDRLSCESAIFRSIYEPDYAKLASRIAWNDLHKNTPNTFREAADILYNNHNMVTGKHNPLLDEEIYKFAIDNIDTIEAAIDFQKDYTYSYHAHRLLCRSYLQKVNGKTVERVQTMLMRVALGVHGPSTRNSEMSGRTYPGDIELVIDSYIRMSNKDFTHASPTNFSGGTKLPQMSSCFVLSCPDSMGDDDYDYLDQIIKNNLPEVSIPECWKHCAKISKQGGGIGVDLTCVRSNGALIGGTNGRSKGVIPLIKVFNEIARYVDQSGKRKGAIALYLQPWHPDTPEFLEIRLKNTTAEMRAPDVFPALWNPDLFFRRVEEDGVWNFFDPASYPELIDLYGPAFEKRYIELENTPGAACRTMKAFDLWKKVVTSLDESGLPYMHAKDSINSKSNQVFGPNGEDGDYSNLESIRGSNLCCEVMQKHTATSIAVCNLASIALPRFVSLNDPEIIQWKRMGETIEVMNMNLNMVIDKGYYPINYCADNNFEYRPVGKGMQGLADAFAMLRLSWGDKESKVLNQLFSECMYYHSLKKSNELAKKYGPYPKFKGCPASKRILQFDQWTYSNPSNPADPLNGTVVVPFTHPDNNTVYEDIIPGVPANKWNENKLFPFSIPCYDWEALKDDIQQHGLFNSLLVAPMPTATTSQILGFNECFEAFNSNVFTRKGIAGDFPAVNTYLADELQKIGKWTKEIVDMIIRDNGSVQNLDIPQWIKNVYRTVWEISQKTIIDYAADRGAYIDQSQSLNINISRPTHSKLSSMYMYAWKKGHKCLSYYLRSLALVDPVKFNIMDEDTAIKKTKENLEKQIESSRKIVDADSNGYICTDDVCIKCDG